MTVCTMILSASSTGIATSSSAVSVCHSKRCESNQSLRPHYTEKEFGLIMKEHRFDPYAADKCRCNHYGERPSALRFYCGCREAWFVSLWKRLPAEVLESWPQGGVNASPCVPSCSGSGSSWARKSRVSHCQIGVHTGTIR